MTRSTRTLDFESVVREMDDLLRWQQTANERVRLATANVNKLQNTLENTIRVERISHPIFWSAFVLVHVVLLCLVLAFFVRRISSNSRKTI